MEVFPHATAVVLAGSLPPKGVTKRAWRERVLHAQGVRTDELTSIDRIDAALAALTGLLALEGKRFAPGRPARGRDRASGELAPAKPYRRGGERSEPPELRCSTTVRAATPACQALVRGEFAPGHDAKRKTMLWQPVARGPGRDRGARGARMEAAPGDAVDDEQRLETRGDPRGPGARGALRRGERPDLPDVDVRAGRGRPAEALGLRPGREPHARGVRGGARRARGRDARVRVRERDGGGDHAAAHAAARRPRGARRRRLRRDVPVARERLAPMGAHVDHRAT